MSTLAKHLQQAALRAPFPWFGGKSRVAAQVWERFGDVPNYVEPFAGSLAVLLGRRSKPRVETVNDIDCWIANFWRALQADPEGVATIADWPVNEADLHARHLWLVNQIEFRERMKTDPDYFDTKIAGWWVWGICQWIGSGWCAEPGWRGRTNAGRQARGIHREEVWQARPGRPMAVLAARPHRKMPSTKADCGVIRAVAAKRPRLGRGQGRGVTRQLPDLGGDSGATGRGVHASGGRNGGAFNWLCALADRLRRVRVCCGDWTRVTGPAVTYKIGLTGIFLDPPYDMRVVGDRSSTTSSSDKLYEHHDNEISAAVREWAIKHGDNPQLRIAVCGYEGEHDFPAEWEKVAWKANGGFGNQNPNTNGAINATRERIWFSPHCLRPNERLFA